MKKKKTKCVDCLCRLYIDKTDKKKEDRPICRDCYCKRHGLDDTCVTL